MAPIDGARQILYGGKDMNGWRKGQLAMMEERE